MQRPRRYLSTLVCLVAMCAEGPGLRAQQAPPRDQGGAAASVRTGTGAIAGSVMSDGAPSEPVRRVTVTLSETGGSSAPRAAVTDDEGRFAFASLPAGRYLVTAAKAAYLPTAYGVTRPAKPGGVFTGTAISLAEGQRVEAATLRIWRGAVLTGTVRGTDGRPVRDARVVEMYFQRDSLTGVRTPTVARNAGVSTDSRGVYRLFGLAPGDYLILVSLPFGLRDLEQTTDADVQRVRELLRTGAAATPAPRRPMYGYAPAIYPGTSGLSEITPINLGPGEERGGLDIRMPLLPNARLTGTTVGSDGRPVANCRLNVYLTLADTGVRVFGQTAQSDAEGRFSAAGLAPGTYTVEAFAPPAGASGLQLKGRAQVAIAGGGDVELIVPIDPGVTVSGSLVFESGTAPTSVDFSRLRINLVRDDGGFGSGVGTPGADGRFTVPGVSPGRYRLRVTAPPGPPTAGSMTQAWVVKSAVIGDRDALDAGVDIAADVPGALVTLTTRASEIAGAITDGAGRPAPEYFIVAFPADRALWTWGSRRIQQTRPSNDGKFAFQNLPAGEYLIGAVTDVDQNEWFEPAFLEQLLGASVKLTLADGEKKTQDLRIR